MRLKQLDLVRYGRFSGRTLEFDATNMDFHLVFGPNEAGKSTALEAVGDLLFGVRARTLYNFLHDNASMRIGAILEDDGESLEVQRRKGNKDTVLAANGEPLAGGEGILARYLAGADRAFFQHMFSLDHARLHSGGQEILKGDSDVGRTLFAAAAGIAGLRDLLQRLDKEADSLWAPKKAAHREFYIARAEYDKEQSILREHTVRANEWRRRRRACEKAEEECARIDEDIAEANIAFARLERIPRVWRDVRRMQELDGCLDGLQDVVLLPENASDLVEEYERDGIKAAARIETKRGEIGRIRDGLEGLSFDEALVRRAVDIQRLQERRIVILQEKADLPNRRAGLAAAVEQLRADAAELGWIEDNPAALVERIPSRPRVAALHSLLGREGGLNADVANCREELRKSRGNLDRLREGLDRVESLADATGLALVLRTVRERGDLAGATRAAETALETARRNVERRIAALHPGGVDEGVLRTMAAPARAAVMNYRDEQGGWRRRLRETEDALSASRQELEHAAVARQHIMQADRVVTAEELARARERRDRLWNLVKLKHVEGNPVPADMQSGIEEEAEAPVAAFEPAIAQADELADSRFDKAEAAGRVAEIDRKIGELETRIKQQEESMGRLAEEGGELEREWESMWAAAPFDPLSADAMLEWLGTREEALRTVDAQQDAEAHLETACGAEADTRERLLCELAALGIDRASLEGEDLDLIAGRAEDEAGRRMEAAAERSKLEADIRDAAAEVRQREGLLQQAVAALQEWREKWSAEVGRLGLDGGAGPEAVRASIGIIDGMRETAGRIHSLQRDRIDKIERDIGEFDRAASGIVEGLAQNLSAFSSEDAVLELGKRLDAAERTQEKLESGNATMEQLAAEIADIENARRQVVAPIAHLRALAKVDTDEALKEAIRGSDRRRALDGERRGIVERLSQIGDGKSPEELAAECDGENIDRVVARQPEMQAKRKDLQEQRDRAADERRRAREEFEAVGGGDGAAQAAARKQEAVAGMQDAAARYVRARTSHLLLQWAIDRYRQEKQAPLLDRASGLFERLTTGSFARLQIEFDDRDKAVLEGVRPSGARVPVSGLSTGTADQLYLALRIAAVEDYLGRGQALPFIADDLFINFDDERAAAGFEVLASLSRTTQVLFFTHHRHLVDIARRTLGDSFGHVTLTA